MGFPGLGLILCGWGGLYLRDETVVVWWLYMGCVGGLCIYKGSAWVLLCGII